MRKLALGLALAAIFITSAGAQTLKVGDPAPRLGGNVTWIKGDPVDQFTNGKVYVLDFWATWCGPCIASIPDLNKIANSYRDKGVTVIGVAIWPHDGMEPTDQFVAKQGDKMNYVIAADIDDRIGQAYMAAAQLNGIPATMIVDGDGRLAWIGHPMMNVGAVLDNVLSPEYDIAPILARQSAIAKGKKMIPQAESLAKAEKWDESFAMIDKIVALDHQEFGYLAAIKFQYLLGRFQRSDEAYAYGRKIIAEVVNDDPVILENLAKFILEGPGVEKRDLALAHKASQRAVDLTNDKEPAALDTLARVSFAMDDAKQAHEVLSRAIAQVDDPRVKKDMEERLTQYAAAMKKGDG